MNSCARALSRIVTLAVCVIGLHATPARAQETGGKTIDRMELEGSAFGSYIDDVTGRERAGQANRQPSSATGGFSGAGGFQRLGRLLQLTTLASINGNSYTANPPLTAISQRGSASFLVNAGRKTQIEVSADGTSSPFLEYSQLFSGMAFVIPSIALIDISTADAATLEENIMLRPRLIGPAELTLEPHRSYLYGASAQVRQHLSRKSSLLVSGSWREARDARATQPTAQSRGGQMSFNHQLTEAVSFHVGYGRSVAQYVPSGPAARAVSDDATLGIDTRHLKLGRKTWIAGSAGASVTQFGGTRHTSIDANASLTRQLARSWGAAISYSRATQFVSAFTLPISSDAASAGVSGHVTRRLTLGVSAAYARGHVGFSRDVTFDSASGFTQARFRVTRLISMIGEYGYYQYHIPPGVTVQSIDPEMKRQYVMTGVSMGVAFLDRRKPTGDTR